MQFVFSDENFYIAISFGVLVTFGYLKAKRPFIYIMKKRIRGISKAINNAACEKGQALLELTRTNSVVANLPNDIVNIWHEHSVDSESLHATLENELAVLEQVNAAKLADVQRIALRQEYADVVRRAAAKFEADVLEASNEQKEALLHQSIELLSAVRLP
ncbi:MAG: hypothetical protein LBF66_00450 [Holosporales bacterium]|jgi:hypothetical protein|nr:hypothetical protein [Holosporales bacterium]